MRFQDKMGVYSKEEIYNEYCGFLSMSMDEYMEIQNRLLEEQIDLWSNCSLGQSILKGKYPKTIEQFRSMVPLTTYDDYANRLLGKQNDSLPMDPVLWIQTTWEGGIHPLKVAPYTKGMLDTYQRNSMACFILATGKGPNDFDISLGDHMLYALAPLPYATGILPLILQNEVDVKFLPPVSEANSMSFSQRNKVGFKQGLSQGIEYFFGLGSVTHYVSQSVTALSSSKGNSSLKSKLSGVSPKMLLRLMNAKKKCKQENRDLLPKDLFHLKGMMVAGTDNRCYRKDLEYMWGVAPLEVFAGTEPTLIGTETWDRDGMYFFPDPAFYEFISEEELRKEEKDPSYIPRTVMMNEVQEGTTYEIVLTILKGGAFARYRVGDMYRCLGCKDGKRGIPRFNYIDRVRKVIDIAGFTRITENSIRHAIELSNLPIKDFVACKEYNENNRPYMHMYVEMERNALMSHAISVDILKEHLSIYFKYIDNDYTDLKKILGIDPLEITIVKCGTFDMYEDINKEKIRVMNPSREEMNSLLNCHGSLGRRNYRHDWL